MEDNETVEMAALVFLRLRGEMRDVCGMSTLFAHLILLENGPKAVEVDEGNMVEGVLE